MTSRPRRSPGNAKPLRPPRPVLDPPPTRIGEHEVHKAAVLPEVDLATRDRLRASLSRHGLRRPIVRHEGRILAGRARLRLCLEMGVEPRFEDLEAGKDPLSYVLDEAVARRRLNRSGCAITAARAAGLKQGRPSAKVRGCTISIEQAATRCGVSVRLVKSARKVLKAGLPQLVRAVELELLSVSRAEMIASLPKERQRVFIAALELTTTAKERAALVAEFTGRTRKRRRDAAEAIRDLASHVRRAEDPVTQLEKVIDDVTQQAGLRPRTESGELVEPVPSAEPAESEEGDEADVESGGTSGR
jgi:hypothetical protein